MTTKKPLLAILVMLLPLVASAYGIKIGELYYSLNENNQTACVVNGSDYEEGINVDYSGDITIPETVSYEGIVYTVVSLEGGHYEGDIYRPLHNGSFETSRITSIRIPKTITKIEPYTFRRCDNLTTIIFDGDVTSIGAGAFIGVGLTSFTFPNSITSVNNEVFRDCKNLVSVVIPDSVTSIGSYAFQNCSGLNSVTIPNSVTSIEGGAFYNCNGLTSVTIPESVTSIGASAFYGCSSLTSITIPNSVTDIWSYAFSGCSGLISVSIPNSVIDIGYEAFADCSGLKDVYCDGLAPNAYNTFLAEDVKDATLHVKDYYIESFIGIKPWSYFKEIVYELETDFNLTYYVDNEVYKQYKHKYEDVITLEPFPEKEQFTFSGWSEIPETMPGKDVNIYGTFIPTEVTIDDVVYQIKDSKAYLIKNNKIGEVIISSYVEDRGKQYPVITIPSGAFENNTNITSVIIPDGIEEIVARAFYGCKNIATITIGSSISYVGERAFANIDKMEKFTCNAVNVPTTDRTAFENSYINYATLYVPYGSIDAYKAIGPWKDFKEIVPIEGTEPVYVEICAMPTISFVDGKLVFESSTDGAECHYEIKVEDAKEGVGTEVTLSSAYEITVYASKEGYNDSEKNTATLYWVNVDPISNSVIDIEIKVNTNAILVQNDGGLIVISGVADGNDVMLYNTSGQLIALGTASGDSVEIDTNLSSGDVCIIKIGNKSVKYFVK